MTSLIIKLKRQHDGSVIFTAIHADGSLTYQRQLGANARFFPLHDLTHYAVETVLGYTEGFYGLIAAGWEITDFAPPFPRGTIPAEAREVEVIVSLLDTRGITGGEATAAEFQEQANSYVASRRATGKEADQLPTLTEEELQQIRALRAELLHRWASTKPGETLELLFRTSQRLA